MQKRYKLASAHFLPRKYQHQKVCKTPTISEKTSEFNVKSLTLALHWLKKLHGYTDIPAQ